MPIDATKYPQLAKMEAVQDESQILGEFLDWLSENGMSICKPLEGLRGDSFFPVMETSEQLLARRFGVDLNAVERERRQVLSEHNQQQAERERCGS